MINKVEHRIVVLGPGGVGKSCLCIQFIQGHFVQTYDPTVEDSYRKQIELDGHPYMIELLDTAGQDQFASMREQYMKSGDAFVLVYSIADTETLNCVAEIYEQLIAVKGSRKITCILVGNKADLKGERQVQLAEGEALAARWGVLFCESSALYRKTPHKDTTPAHMHAMIGTEEVFMRVLRRLIHPEDLQQTRMGLLSGNPAVHPGALAASHSDSNMENVSELKTLTSNLMRGGNFPLLVTRKKRRLCSIL